MRGRSVMKRYLRFIYKAYRLCFVKVESLICLLYFKLLLRINGVFYGQELRCYNATPALQINRNSGVVSLGNNVLFNSYTDYSWNSKCKLIVLANATLIIGDYSGMNGAMIYRSKKVLICNHVKIGGGTRISDSNHHSLDYKIRRTFEDSKHAKSAPVIIGDDVFIGANCYIGKGVTIGDRSIVAAGSVVVKSIPADEIWGGNPAEFIKKIND